MTLVLDRPEDLDVTAYRRVVEERERIELAESALDRVAAGRNLLSTLLEGGVRAYGVNTGLGYQHHTEIVSGQQEGLQRALLTARASGLTGAMSGTVVRGVMLLRLNAFLSGHVGVGPDLCRFLADRLNDGWTPVVPSGPYGAAGEIGPLAHLFQTFIGEGRVRLGAGEVPAADALAALGVKPVELGPKDGLALVNGSPFATALGLELAGRFRAQLDVATLVAALALVLTGNSSRPYSRRVGDLSRDPAQMRIHAHLIDLLAGETSRDDLPQAPVSFRVVPQVHGAALDLLEEIERRLERRVGAVTDSPLALEASEEEPEGLYPTGGFHAAGLTLFVDALGIAVAQIANLGEKRLHRLLDSRFSRLPEQLAKDPGRHAGVVSVHKMAVALAVETRLLAAPASVHALDTSSGQEDVQAFTFLAAERLGRSLDALETILACELVALRQAAYLRGEPLAPSGLSDALKRIADEIEPVLDDRTLSADVERARLLVRSGRL
jgi:histidine ammonia-lyase